MIMTIAAAVLLQASAADTLVENALHISTSQGEYTTYFNADGTYSTSIGISGSWWLEGSELCVQRSTGEGGCQPLQETCIWATAGKLKTRPLVKPSPTRSSRAADPDLMAGGLDPPVTLPVAPPLRGR